MRIGLRVAASFVIAIQCGIAAGQACEKPIAPGVIYRMEVSLAVPRIVHAIRFSLGAPGMSLKSELGGGTVIEENASKGRETMTEMAARTGALVAINGDFFPFTGDPLGTMVRDGQLLSSPGLGRSVFGWGNSSSAIGQVSFEGTVEIAGQVIPLKGINEECPLNEVVLHTDVAAFAMSKTPNIALVFKMDNSDWAPNGVFTGTFESAYDDAAKIPIQPGNAILTASGIRAVHLQSLIPGEKVKIRFTTKGFDWTKVNQIMGGGPFLIRGGQIAVDAERQGFNDVFSKKRHPRTAMGRTADGDIWIAVIDGRQKISDGATLEETAKVMQRLGCIDAVNLDGGGSSAINILGLTLNRPSDGKERPVANGVVVMGPRPDSVSIPLIMKAPEKLIVGFVKTLSVTDEAGHVIPNAEVLWSSSGDAWIDQGGLLKPIQKGEVEVAAYVRGQMLRTTIEVAEPEKLPLKSGPRPNGRGSKRGPG
ncbi:MAG: phosphodiester glycosidase family protein [Chlorobia bacterium]|nr:phosphodiester glycosidase family protein [Fimbriimonadaceae bacterium]